MNDAPARLPITPAEVDRIADRLLSLGVSEESVRQIGEQYPHRRFTYCYEDDIIHGKPVATRPGFHVYLVGGDEHCLSLTNDFDIATGIVFAETVED